MNKQLNLEDYVPSLQQMVQKTFKRWTHEENFKYVEFLNQQKQSFKKERSRRITKVFKRLSQHIGTKTQSQCKSHHQKMINQHRTIKQITKYFEDKFGKGCQDITSTSENIEALFTPIIEEKPLQEFQSPVVEEDSIFNYRHSFDICLF